MVIVKDLYLNFNQEVSKNVSEWAKVPGTKVVRVLREDKNWESKELISTVNSTCQDHSKAHLISVNRTKIIGIP